MGEGEGRKRERAKQEDRRIQKREIQSMCVCVCVCVCVGVLTAWCVSSLPCFISNSPPSAGIIHLYLSSHFILSPPLSSPSLCLSFFFPPLSLSFFFLPLLAFLSYCSTCPFFLHVLNYLSSSSTLLHSPLSRLPPFPLPLFPLIHL